MEPERAVLLMLLLLAVLLACRPGRSTKRKGSEKQSYSAIAVAANARHTCLLQADHTARCFGGDDSKTMLPTPKDALIRIESGRRFACGIREKDGSLVCWGDCTTGACTVSAGRFTHLALDDDAGGCAWNATGDVSCWGLGHNPPPPALTTSEQVSSIVFGSGWGAALRTDQTLMLWGREEVARDPRSVHIVSSKQKLSAIGGRGALLCVVDTAGAMTCVAHYKNQVPPATSGVAYAVDASNPRGAIPACVLTDSLAGGRELRCSPSNKQYTLPRLRGDIVDIAVADDHVCVALRSGTVECGGDDMYGRVSGKSLGLSSDWL